MLEMTSNECDYFKKYENGFECYGFWKYIHDYRFNCFYLKFNGLKYDFPDLKIYLTHNRIFDDSI